MVYCPKKYDYGKPRYKDMQEWQSVNPANTAYLHLPKKVIYLIYLDESIYFHLNTFFWTESI